MNTQKQTQLGVLGLGLAITAALGVVFSQYVGGLALGLFLYYISMPIYQPLCEAGVPDKLAAILAPLSFTLPAIVLVGYTLHIITQELRALSSSTGLSVQSVLVETGVVTQQTFESTLLLTQQVTVETPENLFQQLQSSITRAQLVDSVTLLTELALAVVVQLSGVLLTLGVALLVAFYALDKNHAIHTAVYTVVSYDRRVTEFFNTIDAELRTVFFGNILFAIFTSVIATVTFVALSSFVAGGELLKYPTLIGLLCGITSLIPVVGAKVIYVPVAFFLAVANFLSGIAVSALVFPVLFLVVAFVIVDAVPDFIVRPYVSSRGDTPTGVLLFSYIFGPLFFGWYGLFLGPILFVSFTVFLTETLPQFTRK